VSAAAAAVAATASVVVCNYFLDCERVSKRAKLACCKDTSNLKRVLRFAALVASSKAGRQFRGSDASIRTHSSYLHRFSIALAHARHTFQALLSEAVWFVTA
jgi:hypothetical protein